MSVATYFQLGVHYECISKTLSFRFSNSRDTDCVFLLNDKCCRGMRIAVYQLMIITLLVTTPPLKQLKSFHRFRAFSFPSIFNCIVQVENYVDANDYGRRTEVAGSVPRDRLLLHVRIHYEKKMCCGV